MWRSERKLCCSQINSIFLF